MKVKKFKCRYCNEELEGYTSQENHFCPNNKVKWNSPNYRNKNLKVWT